MSDDVKSIENQPSKTAQGVAFLRALSALDEREEIRTNDYLAQLFVSDDRKISLQYPANRVRERVNENRPGMYEFITARTKYYDSIVEQALQENIPQLIILGAGYDTRAFRFQDLIQETKIYEMDALSTQQHKRKLLQNSDITIHKNISFIATNFNTDNLKDTMLQAGYSKNEKTLFIWEGVTYYLLPEAVDEILNFVKLYSGKGSSIHFDYSSHSSDMRDFYGIKELHRYMSTRAHDEKVRFHMPKGKIELFLSERGFQLKNHLTADEMENAYLMLNANQLAGKVVPLFYIAQAIVKSEK